MSSNSVFFDSNVVVYFASDDADKEPISAALLKTGGVVSVQVLNEFVNVARRKYKMPYADVRDVLTAVCATCTVVPLTIETHARGLAYAERYQLSIYDGMILAAAVLAGSTTLYSEDMHDGLVIDGVTVKNPYRG